MSKWTGETEEALGPLEVLLRQKDAEIERLRAKLAEAQADRSAARFGLERVRAERDAAREENRKLREWLSHLSWCATCAQDGLSQCETGQEIDAALTSLRTEPEEPKP